MVTSPITQTTFPCCFLQKETSDLEFFLYLDDEEKRDLKWLTNRQYNAHNLYPCSSFVFVDMRRVQNVLGNIFQIYFHILTQPSPIQIFFSRDF